MLSSIRKIVSVIIFSLLVSTFPNISCAPPDAEVRILVFSKTAGFRHIDAIDAGIAALKKLGHELGYVIDTTEDASRFNEQNLSRYSAVVFLNVSGEVFDFGQREAFQRYIQAGGGFLAVHGPTDAEREWPWYGQLIGAYFRSHPSNPNVQTGTYVVVDRNHPATDSLPGRFEREDEFYDFDMVNPSVKVLVTIDEKTYQGGKTGDNHPAVWYHDFDGGRSFYSAMGHTIESYKDPFFLQILSGGLEYVTGGKEPVKLDYSRSIPEQSRFSRVTLAEKLDEPMHLAIAKDGKVFFAQRRGEIVEFDPATHRSRTIGTVPVSARYEDGLLGITLHPAFNDNRQLFVYYTAPGGQVFHTSRFTLRKDGTLDLSSEKVLLEIPKDILDGSHTGGGLLFDPNGSGNLYITVGDNSSPRNWGYAPIDERKGREHWDAQRSAGNANDLRGKILRIHPENNGTYTIPEGNLFPPGTKGTRPEIYTMGHRQPWRISIDSKTGWLYEGEVGPDANSDSSGLGPMGHDEFNQIRKAGNYGWPYFVADNKAYWDYDFETGKSGERFDAARPVNHSVHNTGIRELPPAQKAFIWYPYRVSKEFPLMESGARSATGGPVFRKADFNNGENIFPDYYEGKWFITDWLRGWINVVSMDEAGNYQSMERFLPGQLFNNPIDMQFGPDGSLYMLEYGKGWFRANDDARLIKIVYHAGNRIPVAKVTASSRAGAVPCSVSLSPKGTVDADQDELKYDWKVLSNNGEQVYSSQDSNAAFVLDKPGVFTAQLTVKDHRGGVDTSQIALVAGNDLPEISLEITQGNSTFFFPGKKIGYKVRVKDKEDGESANGTVNGRPVNVTMDYVAGGYTQLLGDPDPSKPLASTDAVSLFGGMILNSSDCYSCHTIDKKSAGPSFKQIAARYKSEPDAAGLLVQKIIHGGSGNWGEVAMSAHPDLEPGKAKQMVSFILSLSGAAKKSLPLEGSYTLNIPAVRRQRGESLPGTDVFVLRASYTDSGRHNLPGEHVEQYLVLRNPQVSPARADQFHDVMKLKVPGYSTEMVLTYGSSAWYGFRSLDLTGISEIGLEVSAAGGGKVQVRIDAPDGPIIAESEEISPRQKFSNDQPLRLRLKKTRGKHDLFIVSKNDSVSNSDISFSFTGVRFINESQ